MPVFLACSGGKGEKADQMDALIINGPAKLSGKVRISGSKNTALPLFFSSLLFDEPVHYENVPRLWDVETTLSLLHSMGTESSWDKETGKVTVHPLVKKRVAPYEWVKKMRAGILALGPLVAKYGEAKVSLPGGCAIGARPVNFHIDALRKLGAQVEVKEGYIHASVPSRLKGAPISFPEVTVTGTENLLIVATQAEGETILQNSAREPEVVALGNLLQSLGARIEGLGTPTIRIWGSKLNAPARPISIPPDRIEAGTWIAIAMATQSELELENCPVGEMESVLEVFRRIGAQFEMSPKRDLMTIYPRPPYKAVDIDTQPYPGFATDMQAQAMAVLCLAQGKSRMRETIFENRFMHVAELRRLGAQIEIDGNSAIIAGPVMLQGAPIMATDLRASASLMVAALAAKGQTRISRIYHLDRGYQRLDEKLRRLGADITRVTE